MYNCGKIGRKNYWIGKDDAPRNYVEEYIQQWYKMFLTGDYMGIEYWVYKSEDGHSFDPFHFDKDEMDPQICLLYTSPSPRDKRQYRMPSSA